MLATRYGRSLARMRTQSSIYGRSRYLQAVKSSRSKSTGTSRAKALSESYAKKNGTTTNTVTGSSKTVTQQMSAYLAITDAAADLQKRAANLQKRGSDSLFTEKESTSATTETVIDATDTTETVTDATDTTETTTDAETTTEEKEDTSTEITALTEIKAFIKDYNKIIDKMNYLGDAANNIYLKNIKKSLATQTKDLEKIGITVISDGTLSVKQSKLEAADMDDLEDVFGRNGTMMVKPLKYLTLIESNATKVLSRLESSANTQTSSIYNRYGRVSSASTTSSQFSTRS